MKLTHWAREPLVHFVALGFALYVALTWGGSPPDPASRVISVGAAEKEKIAESWALSMGRYPSDDELAVAIDAYVREEVLYREALRLGLDESDAIVRRRLVSKMDLSASLAAETAEPSDAALRSFLAANTDKYAEVAATNASMTFQQAYFREEASALAALKRGDVKPDPTSLPASIEAKPMREVEARFGQQFAQALARLEPGADWQGPIASGMGWHLVRLSRRDAEQPHFDELRTVLANDWRNERIAERKRRAYEVLASAYRIDIER